MDCAPSTLAGLLRPWKGLKSWRLVGGKDKAITKFENNQMSVSWVLKLNETAFISYYLNLLIIKLVFDCVELW